VLVVERYIGFDLHLIKKIINETSNKYDNFKHFIIKELDGGRGLFSIFLYFDENEVSSKKEKVYVEYLKDVGYSDIDKIIKNASSDFDGYVKADIIKNRKNEYIADVVLTYKVPRAVKEFNLSFIKYFGGGGGIKYEYEHYHDFMFYKYMGEEYSDYCGFDKFLDWSLKFNYYKNHILICKDYGRDSEENLFKLSIDKENEYKIKITKFISENELIYGSTVSEVKYKEIDVEDIGFFVADLIKGFEDELSVKISKPTYPYIEDKLKRHLKYKIENMKKIS
jgi:hypothetical protein